MASFLYPNMKLAFSILLAIGSMGHLPAQNLYGHTWLLGYGPNLPEKKFGGVLFDFREQPVKITYEDLLYMGRDVGFSHVCDAEGNLKFYTNGCVMTNAKDQLCVNGKGFNAPGNASEMNCETTPTGYGYPTLNNLFLPMPGSASKYFYLHTRFDYPTQPAYFYQVESLLYSVVEETASGPGKVLEKNVLLARDTFYDLLSAVRHGNGRDWWIACPQFNSSDVTMCLLTPEGVKGPWVHKMPLPWWDKLDNGRSSQAVFSPDGRLYARASLSNGLQVFHFDRCTGKFFDGLQLTLPFDPQAAVAGVCFSPNNRFVYTSTGVKLFQFDLESPNVQASRVLIAEYDGHIAPFWTTFFMMQLAPDGKIYMNATNGVYKMHVIHNPDAKGLACNMEQHGLELPVNIGFTMINFPDFQLLDLPGSPCDTLGISSGVGGPAASGQAPLSIAPNPAREQVQIAWEGEEAGSLRVFDAAGRLVWGQPVSGGGQLHTLVVADWPPGLYSVAAESPGGVRRSGRFVVMR
jgi:hypothetical protein